jgi:hypothetical protein
LYTIEEVEKLTSYSKNTIYSLTSILHIKPFRNQVKGKPSKGCYDQKAVNTLLEYKRLTLIERKSKKEALEAVKDYYEVYDNAVKRIDWFARLQ